MSELSTGVIISQKRHWNSIARALSYQPNHIDALCRVGSTLLSLLRIAEAKPYIDKAATLAPEDVHVLNAYGLLYNTLGDSHAAVQYYRKSLSRYPDHANTYCNLSNALRKIGQLTEALEAIRKGIELGSDSADSQVIEAGVLMSLGQVDEAADLLRHSIERKNGYRDAHDTLLMCMHYQHSTSLKGLYEEHVCWDKRYAVHLRQGTASEPPRIPREKIRIGFTSGDLGAHPVGYFTVRLFESLNRDRFETFIYSDRLSRDWLTQRIQNCVTGWHETSGDSDLALKNKILAENLDVLFDLTGHTAQNRLLVFARRVAPIQISWAGYVGTTGLSEMDYLLADPFHVPPEMEPFITEKVLRMPNGYVTYCPPEKTPTVAKLPAFKNGFLTFAAMCNPAKVNPWF